MIACHELNLIVIETVITFFVFLSWNLCRTTDESRENFIQDMRYSGLYSLMKIRDVRGEQSYSV
jgi:hypothetical protein